MAGGKEKTRKRNTRYSNDATVCRSALLGGARLPNGLIPLPELLAFDRSIQCAYGMTLAESRCCYELGLWYGASWKRLGTRSSVAHDWAYPHRSFRYNFAVVWGVDFPDTSQKEFRPEGTM